MWYYGVNGKPNDSDTTAGTLIIGRASCAYVTNTVTGHSYSTRRKGTVRYGEWRYYGRTTNRVRRTLRRETNRARRAFMGRKGRLNISP